MTAPTLGPGRLTSAAERRAEVEAKLARLRAWLTETGAGGVLLVGQANFAWATAGGHSHIAIGEDAGVASVLVTRRAAVVLTTNIERGRLLDEELHGSGLGVSEHPWHEPGALLDLVAHVCDPATVVSDVPVAGLGRVADGLAALRYTLSAPEVARYRALGRDAAAAVEAACRGAAPGSREADVAAEVARGCVRGGILPLVLLVAADERIGAYRHPLPTGARARRYVLVALTGRRHGLHASLTRMVSFGAPEPEVARRHRAVLRVDARMLLASRPGVRLDEVFAAGARQYSDEGFPGEWCRHHQGGLTGYAGREIFATPVSRDRVDAGQALAWNPSITRVKSEDTVLVTDAGVDVLTATGAWPVEAVDLPVGTIHRPAMLVRD